MNRVLLKSHLVPVDLARLDDSILGGILPFGEYVCQSISIRISSRPRLRDTPSCVPFRCSTTPATLRSHRSLAPDWTKPGPPLLCVYNPLKSEMLRKL